MARPVVSTAAEELYEGLEAFAALDEANDWPLLRFCEAIVLSTLSAVFTYAIEPGDEDADTTGWAVVLDPDEAPVEVLPWLAQFVGVEVLPEWTEEETREAIKQPEGFARGTPAAIVAAVKRTLTGSQQVILDERFAADAYAIRIRTLTGETPDEAATEAAILTQKPIGLILTYEAVAGQDWGDLMADHATWADVLADYDTWGDVLSDPP